MHSILAVDDSASMRQMVSFTLKNAGFNVVEAVDGQDAWEKASARDFSLVLTDQNMPRMDGISLTKLWFSVSPSEQRTRFTIRHVDPVRQWKLSPTDLASLDKWDDYTSAKEDMFTWTDTEVAPWTVVKSNDKKRARVNAMRHVLSKFEYDDKDHAAVGQPDPAIVGRALSHSD